MTSLSEIPACRQARRNSKFATLLVLFVLSLLIFPNITQAQILPACTATGNCGICDFLDTFVNIIRWVLGIIGGTALFLLVWHGFTWITSGGSKEKIDAGRKGMVHTIIGIVIILAAWQLVNIVIVLLVNEPGREKAGLFKNNTDIWYQYCAETNECQSRGNGSPCKVAEGLGKFCLNNTCGLPDQVSSACEYWATESISGSNHYTGYACRKPTDCDPYENLGTTYCPKATDGTFQACCKKKE